MYGEYLCPAGADVGESEYVNAGDDEESRSASVAARENLLLLCLPQLLCLLLLLLHLSLPFPYPSLAPSLWQASLSPFPSPRSLHVRCWEECERVWDIVQRASPELGGVGADKKGVYLER